MKNKKVLYLTQAAMIAALYVVLTQLAHVFGLDSQAIQPRFSEALTILPFFTPAAIPGLFIGRVLANFFAGQLSLGYCIRQSGNAARRTWHLRFTKAQMACTRTAHCC